MKHYLLCWSLIMMMILMSLIKNLEERFNNVIETYDMNITIRMI